jgi:hypothetical protein
VGKGLLGSLLLLTAMLVAASCGSPASQSSGASASVSPTPSPSAAMTSYEAGDEVGLANGLTVVVPAGLSAFMITDYPGGPTESFSLLDSAGEKPVSITSLSADDLRGDDHSVLQYKLVAESSDGTVEVRWVTGKYMGGRRFSHVAVVTHLPGRLTGMVIPLPAYGRDRALTRPDALRQAAELWELLSTSGAELPDEAS